MKVMTGGDRAVEHPGHRRGRGPRCNADGTPLHPTPYTLHPASYTLHPTPYTLHPTPYTLHPAPYTLHPTPYSLLSEHMSLTRILAQASKISTAIFKRLGRADLRGSLVHPLPWREAGPPNHHDDKVDSEK